MGDKVPVPTLSRMGWVYDTYPKFDFLMAHWVGSDKRQSELMPEGVYNLQWIVYRHLQDMAGCASMINVTLTRYLSSYFDDVNVSTSTELAEPETSINKYRIRLRITFTSNGKHVDGSRALLVENGKFLEYAKFNNTGDAMSSV